MKSHQNSISIVITTTDQSVLQQRLSTICKRLFEILTHYDTPKVVRFESKWIASLSSFVKLSLAISCIYLMCQRKSYQIFDSSPISAVTIKVKPSPNCSRNSPIMHYFPFYNCTQSLYDVNDFILPATENSADDYNTTTEEKRNNYSLINATAINTCNQSELSRCILHPFFRRIYEDEKMTPKPELCWYKLPDVDEKRNYQALDYILFIKHYVEFPLFHLVRDNLRRGILEENYMSTCEYDENENRLCPKFRILKILKMIEDDPDEYESMFYYGSLIEIKIDWKCNLDKGAKKCEPSYKFQRLDHKPYKENPYQAGSSFLTAKHFFRPKDRQLHRIHAQIYNLHIVVSVTGEVGKFDLFQTTTSIGSFLGIFGAGSIACDLIAAFFTNFKTIKYDS
ncbi:hypothetical protein I4U23_007357 [Adineta vaga]|nr:hypothetical protein I4U23_007357 [Adineta vaga]